MPELTAARTGTCLLRQGSSAEQLHFAGKPYTIGVPGKRRREGVTDSGLRKGYQIFAATPDSGSFRTVRLRGENKIAFRQSVDLVGPDNESDFPPGEMDIRMMPLGLGQLSDPVGEGKSRAKILEAEFLFQMVLGHHPPPPAQFIQKPGQLRSLERR